jgi:hypothetical protein
MDQPASCLGLTKLIYLAMGETMSRSHLSIFRCVLLFLGLSSLWVALGLGGGVLFAAPALQLVAIRAPTVRGALPLRYNAHYLGLEPTIRDSVVTLTLAYDPQDKPHLRGFVNFMVLTEDGLRRFLAGEDPDHLDIAAGSPLPFDPIGNKMAAAFLDSGRGNYTVIVFNNADTPIDYTLTANNALLIDGANQTQRQNGSPPLPLATTTISSTAASSIPGPTVATVESTHTLLPGSITARRVSGSLTRRLERHFLSVTPDVRDGLIQFHLHFDPQDVRDLLGNFNFLVLDEDGLRRMIAGARAEELNLATGFPIPFNPFPNELQASFTASGSAPYTVIVYNQSDVPATYILTTEGGVLIDQYGQTNEAKVAAVELAALNQTPNAGQPVSPAPALTDIVPAPASITVTQTLTIGVERLVGELTLPYQHHYLGLTPTIRNGLIVVLLDYAPQNSQLLSQNLNFWVVDEDGLRRVVNGARPEDVGIAHGSRVEFGADKGKLRAIIAASGYGKYTILVYNHSTVPATYQLRTNGGLLTDQTAQTSLP